jgi:hypothetical protein
MPEDHEDEDKSIVDALSSLGWVEEKESEDEGSQKDEQELEEQLLFLKEENEKLRTEIES